MPHSRTRYPSSIVLGVLIGCGLAWTSSAQGQQTPQPQQVPQQSPQAPQPQPQSSPPAPQTSGGDFTRATLAYPTGEMESSVLMVEKVSPTQVRVGQPFKYQIQVTNIADEAVAGVTVEESLGQGFQLQSSKPESTPSQTAGQLRWYLGQLQANESRTIEVTTIAGEEGSFGGCLSVTCEPALCTVVEVVRPQLTLQKTGPEAEAIYSCEPVQLQYVVSNTGSGAARNVVVEDPLPDGLVTAEGQKTVTWQVGDLNEGDSRRHAVEVRAQQPGNYEGRAVARSDMGEAYSQNVAINIVQPEVAVQVSGPQWQYFGQPVTFQVDVQNSGDVVARNAVLNLEGPGLSADERVRKLGDLEPGQAQRFAVTIAGADADRIRLAANTEGVCAPEAKAEAVAELRRVPALLLETVDNYDPVPVGESTTYTIAVKNQGSGAADNVQLQAVLPPQMQFVQAKGPTQVTAQGQNLQFQPIQSLPAGEVAVYVVDAKAAEAGDVQFRVELNSDFMHQPAPDVEPTRLLPQGSAVAARFMPQSPQEPIPTDPNAPSQAAAAAEPGVDQNPVQVGANQPAPGQPAPETAAPAAPQPTAPPAAPQPAPQPAAPAQPPSAQ